MIFIQVAESVRPGSGNATRELAGFDTSLLKQAARDTLEFVGAPSNGDLSIVLTDETQIQDLNRQFRGIDSPTDVLSFPSDEVDPELNAPYLGDIIISVQRAARQAEAEGHSFEDEICLLVVHGVLHLLGYDHDDREGKERMWTAQAKILTGLGRSITGLAS